MVNQGRRVRRGGLVSRARAAESKSADEANQFRGNRPEGEHEESLAAAGDERWLYNRERQRRLQSAYDREAHDLDFEEGGHRGAKEGVVDEKVARRAVRRCACFISKEMWQSRCGP
jgi:hypothetical protein